MAAEQNITLVRGFFEDIVNARRHEAVDELIAPDFVLHSAMIGEAHGLEAFKRSATALVAASR